MLQKGSHVEKLSYLSAHVLVSKRKFLLKKKKIPRQVFLVYFLKASFRIILSTVEMDDEGCWWRMDTMSYDAPETRRTLTVSRSPAFLPRDLAATFS